MINVVFQNFNPESGSLFEKVIIKLSGHADYAVKGSDIVCSAASVLVQTTEFTIAKELGLEQTVCRENDQYILEIECEDSKKEMLDLLIKNCYFGLELIKRNYPEYINIKVTGEENGT